MEFEGEFLNGKRWYGRVYDRNTDNIKDIKNGTGNLKEFDIFGNLIFEGEYVNGKKNGKGKEFYENNTPELKFEGEYLNDKRNGKGKEYYINGKLIFAGEYLNSKRWKGKIYGKYNNNYSELKGGKGFIKEYDEFNFIIYECKYINGERNGKGKELTFFDERLIYEYEYLNGKRHGIGMNIIMLVI